MGREASSNVVSPRRVLVTHGEPAAFDALRRRLRGTFGWNVVVPDDGATWTLEERAFRGPRRPCYRPFALARAWLAS